MAFQCTVLTPEQQVLDQKVKQVILPAHDGLVGILTDRAPLLIKLGIGPLRIDLADDKKQYFFIDGGLAQMKNNVLSIVTQAATAASEIDHEAAVAEYKAALARKAATPAEIDERDKALQRARVKQHIGELAPAAKRD